MSLCLLFSYLTVVCFGLFSQGDAGSSAAGIKVSAQCFHPSTNVPSTLDCQCGCLSSVLVPVETLER